MWKVRMREKHNEFNPIHYYLANIAAEVARGNAKHPNKIKLEDKLLKFQAKPRSVPRPHIIEDEVDYDENTNYEMMLEEKPLPEAVQKKMELSKMAWLGLFHGKIKKEGEEDADADT